VIYELLVLTCGGQKNCKDVTVVVNNVGTAYLV